MKYQCEMIEKTAQPLIAVHTRTPVAGLPAALGRAFMSMMQYLAELGEDPLDNAPFVTYYNMDMDNLDIEASYPVRHELPAKDDIQSSTMPAGRYATVVYTGPYDGMPPAYEALTGWVNAHGLESTGIVYEQYLNDPSTTPPEKLQTRIWFPLKP